jgi:hypothetical protein
LADSLACFESLPGGFQPGFQLRYGDVLAAPQHAKADSAPRTLTAISIAHWLSHFHLFVLPMLFPFLEAAARRRLYRTRFCAHRIRHRIGLTQAPIGYLADHYGARRVLLIGLCLGGSCADPAGLNLVTPR